MKIIVERIIEFLDLNAQEQSRLKQEIEVLKARLSGQP